MSDTSVGHQYLCGLINRTQREKICERVKKFVGDAIEERGRVGPSCIVVWIAAEKLGLSERDQLTLMNFYRKISGARGSSGFMDISYREWTYYSTSKRNNIRIQRLNKFCNWILAGDYE